MRVLLDECIPARLKDAFSGHAVQTVPQIGWRSSKDRALLEAIQDRFDVFVTVDRKLPKQYDLAIYRIGFVIVCLPSNRLESFRPVLVELREAVEKVRAGEIVYVYSPDSRVRD